MINLYTTSTIGSYTTGTVTCTKNSANVTGSGTTWSEIVNPGDILTLNDDKLYVIKTVNSNTSITLDKVFAENTVSNSAYRIFLNTAAHFPSDTAAKVERALEQLSDINEAAINNDRTVTAATKVNGKGIESTTGFINLNPPSVNSNNGGSIRFHYNQGSTATSKIWENASGQIRVDGKLSLGNHVTSGISNDGMVGLFMPAGASNNFREFTAWKADDLTNYANIVRVGNVRMWEKRADLHAVDVYAQIPSESNSSNTVSGFLHLEARSDGYHSESLGETPATDNNSTQIATTAFVRNYLGNTLQNTVQKMPDVTIGTAVSAYKERFMPYIKDANNATLGCMSFIYGTDKASRTTIQAFNTTSTSGGYLGELAIGCNSSGNVFTKAPTPDTTDNSTQIATTAFVKNFYNADISRLIVNHYQLSYNNGVNNTISFNMQGNIAVVFAKRDAKSIVMVFDTWNSAPTILSYTGNTTFITGSMASNWVKLTHGGETGSIVIMAFTGINAGHWFN